LSAARFYLGAALLVRTLGARLPVIRRTAWPLALSGWILLLGTQVPKVVGADFGWRSGAPEMPVSSTAVPVADLPWGHLSLWIVDEDRLSYTQTLFEPGGSFEGRFEDPPEEEEARFHVAETHLHLLEDYREDESYWEASVLPFGIGLVAGPDAPFRRVMEELRWLRDELGVDRARLCVQLPESYGGWRVWLAGYPTRWSRPAFLPVLLAEPPGGGCARLATGAQLTYAQVVSEIDALRAAGNEQVLLGLAPD
jgi:hypothetical protein